MMDYNDNPETRILSLEVALGTAIDALNQIINTQLKSTSYITNPEWSSTYRLLPYLEKVLAGEPNR